MDANAQSHKLIIFDARQNSVADTNKVHCHLAAAAAVCSSVCKLCSHMAWKSSLWSRPTLSPWCVVCGLLQSFVASGVPFLLLLLHSLFY